MLVALDGIIWKLSLKYQHLIHDHELEDLLQEGRTHLWKRLDDYNPHKGKATTFAHVIVENKFKNMVKSRKNNRDIPIEINEEELIEDNNLSNIEKKELRDIILYIHDYKYKDIITKIALGFTMEFIGKEYNISKQRVSKIWNEFIKNFKEEI